MQRTRKDFEKGEQLPGKWNTRVQQSRAGNCERSRFRGLSEASLLVGNRAQSCLVEGSTPANKRQNSQSGHD